MHRDPQRFPVYELTLEPAVTILSYHCAICSPKIAMISSGMLGSDIRDWLLLASSSVEYVETLIHNIFDHYQSPVANYVTDRDSQHL